MRNNRFTRNPEATGLGLFLFVWLLILAVNVGVLGVVIWAIIKVVNHFTG